MIAQGRFSDAYMETYSPEFSDVFVTVPASPLAGVVALKTSL
jgi:hypothetical protein